MRKFIASVPALQKNLKVFQAEGKKMCKYDLPDNEEYQKWQIGKYVD